MPGAAKRVKKTVVYDEFTKRLVNVFNTLAILPAFKFVKDFTDLIDYELHNWAHVRNRYRNFPKKRHDAVINILEREYGVNPLYLREISDKMFIRKPKKLDVEGPTDYLLLDFKNKQQKLGVLGELQETKDINQQLVEQLRVLQEQNAEYKRLLEKEQSAAKKPARKKR
ncbi:MAG TPA: hypothetical protein VEB40_16795 [Flavipsychrobacter sp.]|nr:hypothetical protein [Flavipsychrobacter sp.]